MQISVLYETIHYTMKNFGSKSHFGVGVEISCVKSDTKYGVFNTANFYSTPFPINTQFVLILLK